MDERLGAVFGREELAWLRRRVRERLATGRSATGTTVLRDPTLAQRDAVARLLGRAVRPGAALSVDLEAVSLALRRAGLADDVADAVLRLEGPVEDRPAARAALEAAWALAAVPLDELARERPELVSWVAGIASSGLLRRLGGAPDAGALLAADVAAVLRRLPAGGVRVARLANEVLGRSHGLDLDQRVETLARSALEAMVGPPALAGAEGRRETWAEAGVLIDDVTTQVIALNVRSDGDGPADGVLAAGAAAGEPVVLTLGMLTRHPPSLPGYDGVTVSICENVSVVSDVADALGPRAAPLVCTRGQPTVAVLRLLDLLAERGADLRYHGDFDWPGLRIANRVFARVPVRPWLFTAEDYGRAVRTRPGRALRGLAAVATWDAALAPAMAEAGCGIEEEAVLSDLIASLVLR